MGVDRRCDFDDLNLKKMDKEKFVELREKILQQGSTYASENWDAHEKPNEHDNAHDDFIAGALWLIKNHSDLSDVSDLLPDDSEIQMESHRDLNVKAAKMHEHSIESAFQLGAMWVRSKVRNE